MLRESKYYKQLNHSQRDTLYRHYSAGIGVKKIAEILQVHRSTVYRELKRNCHPGHKHYLPDTAQTIALERRHRPGSKIKRSKQLQQLIEEGIAMLLSPEVIAGRLKREKSKHTISHESIYKWIYFEAKSLKLHEKLCRRKRYRGLRPSNKSDKIMIPERTSIHERADPPPGQMGHWEADTVHFSKGIGAVVTLYDKTTKILFGAKMITRKTQETIDNIKTIFMHLPKELRRTITFDNGSEFTNHCELREFFKLKTYFCDTYASWQKGGVENVNGILRRFIPRGSKADDYSFERVQQIIHQINSTPRKSLGYLSAYEFLLKRLTSKTRIIPLFNQSVALRV